MNKQSTLKTRYVTIARKGAKSTVRRTYYVGQELGMHCVDRKRFGANCLKVIVTEEDGGSFPGSLEDWQAADNAKILAGLGLSNEHERA